MNIVIKPVKDLTPYERNPRKNDGAVEYVAASIKEFGFRVPLVIDKDNVIVAGHTRYKAAKRLRIKEVPCIVADDLTDEQVKAYRLADNKVAEFATWDTGLLDGELAGILDFDMAEFGFAALTEDIEEEEEIPAEESSFDYEAQCGVIVICTDEQEQQAVYSRLVEEGYECKVVAT